MEFRVNDFIETIDSNSVFRGKLFQIITFGDQRQFGHTQRFARIKNMETKAEVEDTIDQIALVRKLIRAKCKTLSVRNSRGTGYGWININGSKTEWGEFTDEEKKVLDELGLRYGLNSANISPENRKYYLRKWLGLPQEKEFSY